MANTTGPSAGESPKGGGGTKYVCGVGYLTLLASLLQLDLRACVFELLFDLGRLVLVHIGLDLFGSALDEVFCFLEAQTGDCTDFLDHVDLLVARRSQNDRKFGLFGSRGSGGSACDRASGHGNRSSSRYAPLLFQELREIRGFQDS